MMLTVFMIAVVTAFRLCCGEHVEEWVGGGGGGTRIDTVVFFFSEIVLLYVDV